MDVLFIESNEPLTAVKGVGEKVYERLNSIGLFTVNDALYHLPSSYRDMTVTPLNAVVPNETATVEGVVETEPAVVYFRGGKNRLTVFVTIDGVYLKATFFNQPYLRNVIREGDTVKITGKIDMNKLEIKGQTISKNDDEGLKVRYGLQQVMHTGTFQKIIKNIFESFHISYELPNEILEQYQLMPIRDALYILHFPETQESLNKARRTFKFFELYHYQIKIMEKRQRARVRNHHYIVDYDNDKLKEFIKTLPFELTEDQKRSTNEICRDLKDNVSMHRLLQGDVGSGKTVVSGIAAYAIKTIGEQVALMVPTEVLAMQHYESFTELFGDTLNIYILTASSTKKERAIIQEALQNGTADLVIGTHSLIEDDVVFSKLSLIIIDEQHRFGVNQRGRLIKKSYRKNVLYMTATPIPRTLAITTYGDMDVSLIKSMPKGRKPVITKWHTFDDLDIILNMVRHELDKGHSIYVVAPLIEESETLEVENVSEIYTFFIEHFGLENVELVHGQLKSDEKNERMAHFENLEKKILISTTVIEVGINVPNATLMLIYNAERYGLSTLHQLRGRVGRSDKQSYCILLSNPKTENAHMRMQIMTETTDGFVLSERDLEMRGPGDYFGVRQSGLPEFKVANLLEDYRILEHARQSAIMYINKGG